MPESLQTGRLIAVNPFEYPDWDSWLAGFPDSCFFHGTAWARVLQETYGHRPFYLCSFADGQLRALLPVMEVSGFLTGRRGVSLPFSDFCPVLKASEKEQSELFEFALEQGQTKRWCYFECRSGNKVRPDANQSLEFYSHRIDLAQGTELVLNGFDDSAKRGIRKAEKTGLQIKFSSDTESVRIFYALHCQTRRRHGLPPQPFRFFENIAKYVLTKGQGFVSTALLDREPVAAAVFLHNSRQVIYKFGASNFAMQHLRANNFIMGKTIEHCSQKNFQELHLGRTSLVNEGLRRFKTGFGASEERIGYYKYDFSKAAFVSDVDRAEGWVNSVFRCMPLPFLRFAGRWLYPNLS